MQIAWSYLFSARDEHHRACGICYFTWFIFPLYLEDILHHTNPYYAGLQTSAQSLPGVIAGVASIVGNAGGGWIMENYGSSVLYRTTSGMVFCSTLLFLSFSAYSKSRLARKTREESSST